MAVAVDHDSGLDRLLPTATEADAPLKRAVWDALREVPDTQLYTAGANVADLGYIYDVLARAGVVYVLMTMPHRGRPKYRFVGDPIRERLLKLDGVRDVIVDFTWLPPWTPARLTPAGRQQLGLAGLRHSGYNRP